jgi:3-hydroxymyristoyl/3-hydroxydecanoyl-(acyl carrier protein) dehydratase
MSGLLDRIPHRPPWLLVDRVVSVVGPTVTAERRLASNDPLMCDGLPELLCVEALAQTAACLRADEVGTHRGYLVAISGFSFEGRAQAGETLLLTATRTAALGALHKFDGTAQAVAPGGQARLVARGQMTFAVEK